MLNQAVILLIIVSFLDIVLGASILVKNPKERINRTLALFALAILVWINASYFEDEFTNLGFMQFFLKVDFSSGAFAAFLLLLFCVDITKIKISNNIYFRSAIYVVPIIFSILIFSTHFVISGFEITQINSINPVFGPGEIIYNTLISLALFSGIGLLVWKYRRVNPEDQSQFIYLFIGFIVSVLTILLTNIILTKYIENSVNYNIYSRLGSFSTVFIVLSSGYAIIKHRLLNLKIITTELISLGILVFILFQVLRSQTVSELIINGIIFIVLLLFIIMLVRSVENEVERKEELQKISDALAIANQRLKELDTAKSEFISIASHQLRTPLTAIKGYVSLLLEGSYGAVAAPVQDVLNKIYSVNSRLVQLVEDLLNVSRIEAGRIQYNFQPTHIEPIIAELVDMFAMPARDRHLELKMQLAKKLLPELTIDPNKIKEVVSNLIDNALKYTKEGSVTVSLEASESAARIIVSDTGIGIKPEDRDRLFNKFTRTKETTKLFATGTGLGLYVGKNFVEAHGGKILVESDGPNLGSRFIVELPFVNPKINIGTSDQPSSLEQGK